jgi:hypothetical protein
MDELKMVDNIYEENELHCFNETKVVFPNKPIDTIEIIKPDIEVTFKTLTLFLLFTPTLNHPDRIFKGSPNQDVRVILQKLQVSLFLMIGQSQEC